MEAADVLIGLQRRLEDSGEACISTARRGQAAVGDIRRGYVYLDPKRVWGHVTNGAEPLEDLKIVLGHEFGHVLGLAHPDNPQSFMAHINRGTMILQPADIAGVVRLYGPPTHTGLDQAVAPSD